MRSSIDIVPEARLSPRTRLTFPTRARRNTRNKRPRPRPCPQSWPRWQRGRGRAQTKVPVPCLINDRILPHRGRKSVKRPAGERDIVVTGRREKFRVFSVPTRLHNFQVRSSGTRTPPCSSRWNVRSSRLCVIDPMRPVRRKEDRRFRYFSGMQRVR